MAEYRYYLIPDAMTRAFPEQFEKQTPTEFFDNMPRIVRCAIICVLFQPVILWSQRQTEKRLPTMWTVLASRM